MKPRSIALALAFCVSLVSTSYAQRISKSESVQNLTAVARQLRRPRPQERQLVLILLLQAIRQQQQQAHLMQAAKRPQTHGGAARSK